MMVLPGQYRGQDGQQRVYGEVQISLYASDVADWQAPTITSISRTVDNSTVTIVVGATDNTGIRRVVAYTDGEGGWQSVDLAPAGGDTWQGTLELSGSVEYFVQVVDQAGYVSIDDNGGSYYSIATSGYQVYLPLVMRNNNTQWPCRNNSSEKPGARQKGAHREDPLGLTTAV